MTPGLIVRRVRLLVRVGLAYADGETLIGLPIVGEILCKLERCGGDSARLRVVEVHLDQVQTNYNLKSVSKLFKSSSHLPWA